MLTVSRFLDNTSLVVGQSITTEWAQSKPFFTSDANPNIREEMYHSYGEDYCNLIEGTIYGGAMYKGQSYFYGHNSKNNYI